MERPDKINCTSPKNNDMFWKLCISSLLTGSLLFVSGTTAAQQTPPAPYSSTMKMNVVRKWIPGKPVSRETDLLSGSQTPREVIQTTEYFDGFGRPLQTVVKQTSPSGNDVVTASVYDAVGREQVRYLPFVSNAAATGDITNDGNFKTDPFQQQVAFYNNQLNGQPGETNIGTAQLNWAYSRNTYEASPLNRVLSTFAPGFNWAGSQSTSSQHAVQQWSLTNTTTDNVRIWNIAAAPGSLPVSTGAYTQGRLYKSITIDEQGHQRIAYKDMYGQVILQKIQNTAAADSGTTGSPHAGWLCTYYVYDDYGNLRFIIPPALVQQIDGTWSITQTLANELCYRCEYDLLNRPIIQKAPGTAAGSQGEVWMVYDVRDRLVMVQDGNMRANTQWLCTLYDALDRPVTTGTISYTGTLTQLQQFVTAQGINSPLPAGSSLTTLTNTFYDNYNWVSGTTLSGSLDQTYTGNNNYFITSYNNTPAYAVPVKQSNLRHGLVTGHMTAVLSATAQNLYTATIYDDHERIIQSQSNNITGGKDIATSQYGWNGKLLRTLVVHNKNGANAQTHLVASAMSYDAAGRLLSTTKTVNSTINGVTVNAAPVPVLTNQYDELGQLKQKTLGAGMETLAYEYNARGWLLGINRSFAKSASSGTNYFGFDLGYDKTAIVNGDGQTIGNYTLASYNGNVAGTVWKSKGDNQVRKYDYSYDVVNRLTAADFNQQTGGQFNKTAGLDFGVSGMSYDANGNITTMSQKGWLPGGSRETDNLAYTYLNNNNSNRLMHVIDNSAYNTNTPQTTLGDFHYTGSKSATSVDYGYDANGNVTSDVNRAISAIAYNYLDLPKQVSVTNKGTIQYIYDAAGNKLQKITTENSAAVVFNGVSYTTGITTTTTYIGGFVYKSLSYTNAALASLQYTDRLQFIRHEEGRIRFLPVSASGNPAFAFDYFIRDQVNNVRMVLTDEVQQDIYPAVTLESATIIGQEQNYYNITNDAAHVIPVSSLAWWPAAGNYADNNGIPNPGHPNPNATSTQVYKLNGQTGDKFGLGIALKVMAGDKISIFGKSIWHNTGATPASFPIAPVLSSLVNAFAGTAAVAAGSHGAAMGSVLNNSAATTVPLTSLLNGTPDQTNPTVSPKAAINWILFNDQFVPVSMGTDLVSSTGDVVKSHSQLNLPMIANGYLYVYCSNESNIDVYFDNLQVVDQRGPLLEETHYYPAGLTMAGISDRAWNKGANFNHYQGMEMQNQEFNDGTGLEEYDFGARYYDQQIGRWHTQDPAAQFASPYMAMGNNWPNGRDPNGRVVVWDDIVVAAVGFVIGYVSYGLAQGDWGFKAFVSGVAGAAIAEGAYLTFGGGLAGAGGGAKGNAAAGAVAKAVTKKEQMEIARSFIQSYALADITSLYKHREQISDASDWGAFGLIAGYSFLSSLDAGFASENMSGKVDELFGTGGKVGFFSSTKGALSEGIGSVLNDGGTQVLEKYNPHTNTWDWDGKGFNILGRSVLGGGLGTYLGKATELGLQQSPAFNKAIYKTPGWVPGDPCVYGSKGMGALIKYGNNKLWEWWIPE
jgi:RHS repeat-associated protein